ncbi:MAG: HDIG domain-containing protein [candidate division Zixibacteria bacterium]|nr:HDIG domain-containing protein [candidate division Zixibacteria bacterium]
MGFLGSLTSQINRERGKIYEVGGPVRDRLLGVEQPKDLDLIVCGIPLEKLKKFLRKYGDINLVGQAFGVIKFKPRSADSVIDISLPRKEQSTGTGHRDFEVDFDHTLPIEEDLRRRDFTINALAREIPSGVVIDPYGGQVDLENRVLRIVSESSFTDDPLRMLRGIQFSARFDLTVETKTLQAMIEQAHLIDSISPERVAEELNKLLEKAPRPSVGFRLMNQTGLLKYVLPELASTVDVEQPGGYHRWDVFEHTLHAIDESVPKLVLRLAALFHDVGKPRTRQLIEGGATFYGHDKLSQSMAETALRRLRYSNDIIKQVNILVDKHMFSEKSGDKGIRRLINKVGTDLIFDLIALRRADTLAQGMGQTTQSITGFETKVAAELAQKHAFGTGDLALNGNDLKESFGLEEGELIGQILKHLLDEVLDEPDANTKEKLLTLSADFLRKRPLDI